jgi:SAM-dependent methyltransferase
MPSDTVPPAFLDSVARYYAGKLLAHGTTPRGVDWNSQESQELRFHQLCKLFQGDSAVQINDIGCGYGQLLSYLEQCGLNADYLGVDISTAMVEAAKLRFRHCSRARFLCSNFPGRTADYSVASGIFNVKLEIADAQWSKYVLDTVALLNGCSIRGFAFNCLSRYSDPERRRSDLYYADPCWLFDHCKRLYSRNVALLHDYGLYEFTIVVRKEEDKA